MLRSPSLVLPLSFAFGILAAGPPAPAQEAAQARPVALDDVLDRLELHPGDVYLQYVAELLREREGDENGNPIPLGARLELAPRGRGTDSVDLFSLFSGAHAIQESLQLETMQPWPTRDAELGVVEVASLTGPQVRSHPWREMLAGREVPVSALASLCPADFYFLSFRSLNRLIEASEVADRFGGYLLQQTDQSAMTPRLAERLKAQLAIETNRMLRPFYDTVTGDVAIVGSDLYVREGSDVTVLFQIEKQGTFRARMDGFLAKAAKRRPDAVRSEGAYLGVPYTHVATPDRAVHVFSAYPRPDLHVRSNSRVALERVLEAIVGRTPKGRPVARLGDTDELRYVRTLLPYGEDGEDGFLYLSDPFVRRIVGPAVKLTETRRLRCYNHLRMIGHAALLHRTEQGQKATSLEALVTSKAAPGRFGEGRLACPQDGTYSLSTDRSTGVCSVHGHARYLVPGLEVQVTQVTKDEGRAYERFREEYNRYWRTFFDPIAVSISVRREQIRCETIVLPLIDNTVYTGLAQALGGRPGPLDALPVPERTIFSMGLQLRDEVISQGSDPLQSLLGEITQGAAPPGTDAFLRRGIGERVGLHVYDAVPTFDLNLPSFLGEVFGSMGPGRGRGLGEEELIVSFVAASFNAPVYLSVPVRDVAVTDAFLRDLDAALARSAKRPTRDRVGYDFAKVALADGHRVSALSVQFGPLKIRFFWARIGAGLYVASKPFILEDIYALSRRTPTDGAALAAAQPNVVGHAMVRIRPEHWQRVRPDYELAWADNARAACLRNLGPLTDVLIADTAAPSDTAPEPAAIRRTADMLFDTYVFCPEGGTYGLAASGRAIACGVHGTAAEPRQPRAPLDGGATRAFLRELGELTATLTFEEDGLHAVLTIDRR